MDYLPESHSNITFAAMNDTTQIETTVATMEIHSTDHPLGEFSNQFFKPAGIASLVVAIFGVVFNIMNIIVLCQPKMRNAVNLLLTMMGVTELFLLLSYIPFVLIFNVGFPSSVYELFHTTNINSARYMLFHVDGAVFFHTATSWLLITTACFRFIFVQYPIQSAKLCTYNRAILAGILTVAASLVISLPNMFLNDILLKQSCAGNSTTDCEIYFTVAQSSKYATSGLILFNFWLYTIVGKFIPAILLLIFTIFLLRVLREAARRKKRLQADTSKASNNSNEHSQTTRMLLAVVILFFLVECPHGLLIIYISVSKDYFTYHHLGEVIDLVTLTAFSLNLILYSTMSRQYRMLFLEIFTKKIRAKLHLTRMKAKYSKCSNGTTLTEGFVSETCALNMVPDSHTIHSTMGSDDSDEHKLVDMKG